MEFVVSVYNVCSTMGGPFASWHLSWLHVPGFPASCHPLVLIVQAGDS